MKRGNACLLICIRRICCLIMQRRADPPGIEFICVYHDDPKVTANENLRTDVCLTLLKPAQPKGEVGVREIPGGKYAIFRYQGPYSNLSAVYDTIYGHWLPESSYKVRDSRGSRIISIILKYPSRRLDNRDLYSY